MNPEQQKSILAIETNDELISGLNILQIETPIDRVFQGVIPPILITVKSRGHVAFASICCGVNPRFAL